MRRILHAISVAMLACPAVAVAGNLVVKPTTTLQALTSNNTSTVNAFVSQSNGNLGANNVSKQDIHSLLYPGARTKIYAHMMMWFGASNHMNVGYSSIDAKQIKRQVNDMISRGIDGVIVDWYGPGSSSDQATQLLMLEAEKHPGFTFALMVDTGAIKWYSCPGCSPQDALIQHLRYAEQAYFGSPAYLKLDGKPFVTNFDIDLLFKIDWNAVKASLTSDPALVFQHSQGFTHALTSGSQSWIMPTTTDLGMSYLSSFYAAGKSHASLETMGAVYKGFDDGLASWGAKRRMDQQCGQTWLKTFSKINSLYNSGKQLNALQLVTWNDYEEGTEIESGIDNCVSITASVSGSALKWSISGQENTIDHYTVYISKDGKNVMPLTDMAAGLRSLNLCSYGLSSTKYTFFVRAVGKPSLKNQISNGVSYTSQCSNITAGTTLQATPGSISVASSRPGTTTISPLVFLKSQVSLSCANLPPGIACQFAPAVLPSGTDSVSSVLTISTRPIAAAVRGNERHEVFFPYLSLGLVGLVGIGHFKRKRLAHAVVVGFIFAITILLGSCGGGSMARSKAAGYTVTVVGTSGNTQLSTTVSVTIE